MHEIPSQDAPILYGYARVSSKDQNLDRQLDTLRNAGVKDENIFLDKASGKDFSRPGYQKLRLLLKKGDILYIASLDRLGRNFTQMIMEWFYLIKEKGVIIHILDSGALKCHEEMTLLDSFITSMIVLVQSFSSEDERAKIRQRQKEGIAAAKARGKRFGRPSIPLSANFKTQMSLYLNGSIKGTEAAQSIGINLQTFYSKARKFKNLNETERELLYEKLLQANS